MKKTQSKEPMQVEIRLQRLTKTHAYGSISINEQRVTYVVGLETRPSDNTFYEGQYVMVLGAGESAFLTNTVLKYMARAPRNMVEEMLKAGTLTDEGELEIREFGRRSMVKPTKIIQGLLRKLSTAEGTVIDVD